MQTFPAVMKHRGSLVCFLFLLALWAFCELVPCGMVLPVCGPRLAQVISAGGKWFG